MKLKSINMKEIIADSKNEIYKKGLVGGIAGAGIGFLLSPRVLTLPKLKLVNSISPIYTSVGGAVVGSIVGLLIGSLSVVRKQHNNIIQNSEDNNNDNSEENYEDKLKLRSEVLDLYKQRVQTGEVEIHKEVLEEEKNISIPLIREDLVIEKRETSKDSSGLEGKVKKTIRIPIREEHFKVVKYPVALEDVSVYKNKTQGLKRINETLKTEKLKIGTNGNAKVTIEDNQNR